MDIIKVSGTSRTSAVAGAIAGVFRDNERAEIQAIGADAVNQAIKAVVLARGYLADDGFDVVCIQEFVDVEIEDKVRTAVKLTVTERDDLGEQEEKDEEEEEDRDDDEDQDGDNY